MTLTVEMGCHRGCLFNNGRYLNDAHSSDGGEVVHFLTHTGDHTSYIELALSHWKILGGAHLQTKSFTSNNADKHISVDKCGAGFALTTEGSQLKLPGT